MARIKVLVVDDSLTMRALVAGMLEKDKDIQVVGLADGAAEARTMVRDLKPDVMTLDIEMPGMSGIEYLAELMVETPMPVIMFSTLTAKGAESSIEALRLGAVECYPKPTRATQDEVGAAIGQLGNTVKQAPARFAALHGDAPAKAAPPSGPFGWNGRILAVGADIASTKTMFDLLASLPADGPPAIVVQHMRPELADGMIAKLRTAATAKVVEPHDGLSLTPGTIVFARPGTHHVYVDKWPGGTIRMLDKPTLAGERPSISVLMAMLAKAAAAQTVGVLLAGGEDGRQGVAALRGAGGCVIAPAGDGSGRLERFDGATAHPLAPGGLVATILEACRV